MNNQSDFDVVERALRHQSFGTLSTLTKQGHPHATGVVYAVSLPGEALTFYVTTRTTTRKVHNIRAHPEVAFVVPVRRRFAPGFPPRCIQFQGMATVVSHRARWRDPGLRLVMVSPQDHRCRATHRHAGRRSVLHPDSTCADSFHLWNGHVAYREHAPAEGGDWSGVNSYRSALRLIDRERVAKPLSLKVS